MSEINTKLYQVQQELKAPKGQTNKFGGYKYRSCEDILESVKKVTLDIGGIITLSDDIVEVGGRVYVKATATYSIGNEEISTTAFARESETKKGMDDSQITGSASSYARKYALNGLLCIDDTKDADTMDNREQPKKYKPKTDIGTKATDKKVDDFIKWGKDNDKTADEVISTMLGKLILTDEQKDKINKAF